ncbi:hypothetical protein [Caulobacter hibisci]|uniref:Uncharacterized protein n=1 Tax=Caulobacter hibisci TaxID=2035993 RepID=A0ABS0SVK4_9CAUL|nr:hypothetical protein [Caulobacter hibisci]MBI1683644.1 hypothetical protein [Caulobacter hibisci]
MLRRKKQPKITFPVRVGDTVEVVLRCGHRTRASVLCSQAGLVELAYRKADDRFGHAFVDAATLQPGEVSRWAFSAARPQA